MKTDADIISEIYYLIGRSDPTLVDIAGSAKQVAALIERDRPEIAGRVRSDSGWPQAPLYPKGR